MGLTGITGISFLGFFISHIPVTLLLDSQMIFPGAHPQPLIDLLDWYAVTFDDKLMQRPGETWLNSMLWIEFVFQLPFFFVAVYAICTKGKGMVNGKGWFRSYCMLYGASTATTVVPILTLVTLDPDKTLEQKLILYGFYGPYFIFPVWIALLAASTDDLFAASTKKQAKSD